LSRARICKLLRGQGIDSDRLHKLEESTPWNRFLGSSKVYNPQPKKSPTPFFVETSAKASRQKKVSYSIIILSVCVYQLMNWRAGWKACDGSVTVYVGQVEQVKSLLSNRGFT
jgi:hypothetical protein